MRHKVKDWVKDSFFIILIGLVSLAIIWAICFVIALGVLVALRIFHLA